MRTKALTKGGGLITTIILLLVTVTSLWSQTVTTDKFDYAPGETAIISGTGWLPGEIISLDFEHIVPNIPDHEHVLEYVTANSQGSFIHYWYVDEQELGTTFHLMANGLTSGLYAETFFTDANVRFTTSGLPIGLNVTVAYSGTAPGPIPVNSTISFSTNGSGNSGNIALIGNLTFSFPATITSGSTIYALTGVSPTSPANVPNTGLFPITGTYILQSGAEGSIESISIGSQSSSVIYGTSSTVVYNVTSQRATNGSVNGTYSVSGLPSGVTGVFDQPSFTSTGSNAFPGSSLSLNVSNTINAGSYPFTATLTDGNAGTASTEGVLVISKAATVTTVTINGGPFTYTGAAQTPATVSVTGAGGLNLTPDADYANNIDAGTATASYTYEETANYLASSDSEDFTIGKAATTTVVTINGGPFTYTGAAQTPATVSVTGAGGLNLTPDADYANNTNAGTATASYTYTETANYLASSDSEDFTIGTTPLTITTNPSSKYVGQENPAFTVSYDGFVNNEDATVLGGTLSFVTIADGDSCADDYLVSPAGLTSTNYAITFVDGIVTVNGLTIDASASSAPIPLGTNAILSATITPAVSGVEVDFYLNDIYKGSATTNANGTATYSMSGLTLNLFKVEARVGGAVCEIKSIAYLPVYDPNGSFVTGGGWITSPEGALIAAPLVTGKANFGFVAKYKKGNNQVDGNTEFQFQAGSLNFKSTMHESGSLIISGGKATYRGVGTINGVAGFKFVITGIDGNWNNGSGPDKFRIKIMNATTNAVVYDNQLGSDENSIDATVLGGGSIVIHEAKKNNGNNNASKETSTVNDTILESLEVSIYPNPSTSIFTLKTNQTATSFEVMIYDTLGRVIETLTSSLNNEITFGQNLPSGAYIAIVKVGTEQKSLRIIKK